MRGPIRSPCSIDADHPETSSGPLADLRVPCRQQARVLTDERVHERDHVRDEIGPALGWSQRQRRPLAQRVIAALPIGQLRERLGKRQDGMPAVLGDRPQGRAQICSVDCVQATQDPP
jgi:hypothetical protein